MAALSSARRESQSCWRWRSVCRVHDPFERKVEDTDVGRAGGESGAGIFAERERFCVQEERERRDHVDHPADRRSELPGETFIRGNVVGRAQVAGLGNCGIDGVGAGLRAALQGTGQGVSIRLCAPNPSPVQSSSVMNGV